MKAKNRFVEYDIVKADRYVKRMFPEAEYMALDEGYVMVLERNSDEHNPCMDYRYFNIDGKQYAATFTNRYDSLKKAYKAKSYEQLTLF